MNPRWILIRRLRGPAYLLTFGLTALLHQWGMLSFGQSWPLYLIVTGVLTLFERAALTAAPDSYAGQPGYPGQGYPGQGYSGQVPPYPQGWSQPAQPPTTQQPSTAIVPTNPNDITPEGRQ